MRILREHLKTLCECASVDKAGDFYGREIYLSESGKAISSNNKNVIFECRTERVDQNRFLSLKAARAALKNQGRMIDLTLVETLIINLNEFHPQGWNSVQPSPRTSIAISNKLLFKMVTTDLPLVEFKVGEKLITATPYYEHSALNRKVEYEHYTNVLEKYNIRFTLDRKLLNKSRFLNTNMLDYSSPLQPVSLKDEIGGCFTILPVINHHTAWS